MKRMLYLIPMTFSLLPATAQELDCTKPDYPACVFETETWASSQLMDKCMRMTEQITAAQAEYRHCIFSFRADAIHLVDTKWAEMVAEVSATSQYMKCRSNLANDVSGGHCLPPEFVAE